MAIDSAEKRKSLVGIVQFMPVGVTPNASKDVEWRQEAGWGYPGIAPSGDAPVEGTLVQQPMFLLTVGDLIN